MGESGVRSERSWIARVIEVLRLKHRISSARMALLIWNGRAGIVDVNFDFDSDSGFDSGLGRKGMVGEKTWVLEQRPRGHCMALRR